VKFLGVVGFAADIMVVDAEPEAAMSFIRRARNMNGAMRGNDASGTRQ
jgi:hypothetical protein